MCENLVAKMLYSRTLLCVEQIPQNTHYTTTVREKMQKKYTKNPLNREFSAKNQVIKENGNFEFNSV